MGRRRMSELAFIRRTRPARPGFPSSPRSERIACGDPVPRPRRRGAGRAAGRCGAVRRPSHACSPAARSVRCAPSPPGPRLPAVLSTAGSRQVMGRDSLRGSASPAAIRSPGPAVRGRGADAGFRVVRRPSHAGSPAARSVPLRCTLHLAPGSPPCCSRPARAPSGAARDLPATYRPRRAAGIDPRPPPPLPRGRGCAAAAGPRPRTAGGRTRGLTRRSPGRQVRSLRSLSTWPPGSTPCRSASFGISAVGDRSCRGRGPAARGDCLFFPF